MAHVIAKEACARCLPQVMRLFSPLRFPVNRTRQLSNRYASEVAPLSGLRVLDMTRVLAGPYCTMLLGDLGADVIKIERPGSGDDTRSWGPPFVKSESAYFLSINRNKRSVTINIQTSEGANLIKQLAQSCDVLVENYLPGKLGQYGLGYDDLKQVAPELIYCSITGYGQEGPYQNRAGYDVIAAGLGGLLHITGPEDGEPCRVGVAMTDLSTGLYAYGAIMASLLHRQTSGRGQHIDCNLLSTQVATLTHIASNYLNAGKEAGRYGTGHGSIVPYQAFKTADGYLVVGAGNNEHFRVLRKLLDLERELDVPDYASNEDRVKNRKQLLKILSDRFLEKTTNDWLSVFEDCGMPYGPINNMEQVFKDPQVLHSQIVQTMEHPEIGEIKVPGPAVRYSDSNVVLNHPPPMLGQHTEDVLSELLNLSQSEIDRLRSAGAL